MICECNITAALSLLNLKINVLRPTSLMIFLFLEFCERLFLLVLIEFIYYCVLHLLLFTLDGMAIKMEPRY